MAFPVVNTFIHFAVSKYIRRCKSAPPEFHVNLAISGSANRRTRRRRRQQPALDDQAVFAEFRALAIYEKWAMITQKIATHHRKAMRTETCDQMLALKASACLPRMQDKVPTDLFTHIVNSLGISQACYAILFCKGVLRRNGDTVEIWAREIAAPEVNLLLVQASRFKRLRERGEFMLRLPLDGGFAYPSMPLAEEMTVKDLKGLAAVCCGILSDKLTMAHLGKDLTPPGLLVEHGVLPGSCITVSKIFA